MKKVLGQDDNPTRSSARKSFYLSERDNAIGHNDPRNRQYFVEGKKVDKKEFDRVKSLAVSVKIVDTYNSGGIRHFDSIIYI